MSTPAGGVPFGLPTATAHPHAPWWAVGQDPPAALNPTAAIAGLLHRHAVAHPWLDAATAFCWSAIAASFSLYGYDLRCAFTFLAHAPDRERATAEAERLGRAMLAGGHVALDPASSGHVFMPLAYATHPDHVARRFFDDDVIEAHLVALAGRQQPDGGWPITWEPPSELALLEWRAWATVDALTVLRAYDLPGTS